MSVGAAPANEIIADLRATSPGSRTPLLEAREWRRPHGGKIKSSPPQFKNTVYVWQGAQSALTCFDELTHFAAHQFFYMVSRNHTTCGARPYRAAPSVLAASAVVQPAGR